MKSFDELKAEMQTIWQQMFKAKKNIYANVLKEVKCICQDFGLIASIFKFFLVEERMKK